MLCHVCNAEVGEGQRFCHQCGQSLAGVTDPTEELQRLPDDAALALDEESAEDVAASDEASADAESEEDVDVPAVAVAAAAGAAASEADDALDGAVGLVDTAEVPQSELPGGEAPGTDESTDADTAEVDAAGVFAPPQADDMVAGAIGASLFDPERAPPVAEPDWDEPIPPIGGERDTGEHVGVAGVAAASVAATTDVPVQDGLGAPGSEPHSFVYDADLDTGPPEPLLDGEIQPFRLKPAFLVALLGMVAMLMATVADITDVRTDRVVAGIDNRLTTLDDIGTNLAVAGFIGAALMLVGGLLQCFHLRWGAGLAGGAGLAVIGWAALTIGLAEVPIDTAERITRDPNTPGPFTLTVTRDLGYWLIVAMAGVGLVVFLFSLTSSGSGGRRGLNPWTAALGAVAALVAAGGPLITVGDADFGVNFGTDNLPAAFFAGRLVQLGLMAAAGVVGFLLVRAYGLGLVAGGFSVATWLWLSSLLEIGDRPLGVAAGNLGSSDTTPHAVTTVGIVATLAMLLLSTIFAIVQHRRPPR